MLRGSELLLLPYRVTLGEKEELGKTSFEGRNDGQLPEIGRN